MIRGSGLIHYLLDHRFYILWSYDGILYLLFIICICITAKNQNDKTNEQKEYNRASHAELFEKTALFLLFPFLRLMFLLRWIRLRRNIINIVLRWDLLRLIDNWHLSLLLRRKRIRTAVTTVRAPRRTVRSLKSTAGTDNHKKPLYRSLPFIY